MNRQAQAVVLLLLGGALLKASLGDLYLRYVKEGLRPFLIATGAVLVLTAIMTLWYDLRRRADSGADADEHAGHGHSGPPVGWLLLLPALGLLLVAPPALGSYTANQSGTALSAGESAAFPPLPPGDPVPITVLEYASRAVYDEGRSIGERRVRLTGFVMPSGNGEVFLARIVLSCCAADGRPIKVGMSGRPPTGLTADTWIEVVGGYTGKATTDPVNHEKIPYLDVVEWHEVPPPKNQYD